VLEAPPPPASPPPDLWPTRLCFTSMSLITTDAIVLHTYPYSESSKIVRLATREHGVMSAVAKGAHRVKSAFGARLQILSEGVATVYVRQNRELHTLSAFELDKERQALAQDLHRYAAALAIAELVLRVAPEEPNPALFDQLRHSLDWLVQAPQQTIPVVGLATLWSGVRALGFTPTFDTCAVDGRDLDETASDFLVIEGGFMCAHCAGSREAARLPPEDSAALRSFVSGTIPSGVIEANHLAAHRRLCARFVQWHLAEGKTLHALRFWETLA
jgi:DNA repair protein RecO (recombination protein O)